MTARKLRLILLGSLGGSAAVFLIIAAMGLSILGGKSRHMVDLKLQSQTLDMELNSLGQAKKDVEQYAYFKNVAKTVIPADKDQAETVLEIFQIADQAGISLQSVTFPSSTLGNTKTPASATSTSAKNIISQAQPVSGIPGLYSTQLTIVPQTGPLIPTDKQVTYAKMLDFLSRIEKNRRTAQITTVTIQPVNSSSSLINFTLTINIFIKP